ncbi:hypothetical protein M0804_003523 [Polistes exclamans]|nr:hypothetical protein M0804_003523 [Polistes exclamans]
MSKGLQIVIPKTLRRKILKLAHSGKIDCALKYGETELTKIRKRSSINSAHAERINTQREELVMLEYDND